LAGIRADPARALCSEVGLLAWPGVASSMGRPKVTASRSDSASSPAPGWRRSAVTMREDLDGTVWCHQPNLTSTPSRSTSTGYSQSGAWPWPSGLGSPSSICRSWRTGMPGRSASRRW